MTNWLIRKPQGIITGADGHDARVEDIDIRVRDGYITEMGADLVQGADETLVDARDCVVYPGWVNTHHHLFQSLLKAVPAGMQERLDGWLSAVPYRYLERFDVDLMRAAARLGMTELLLSGTTTVADHHYLYYQGGPTELGDLLFEVADELGMRFVLCRGGATQPSKHPGYPSHLTPESTGAFIKDVERLANLYHQDSGDAKRRVVMAPTTPTYSVSPEDLRTFADAARQMGLRMHTHLSETEGYVKHCQEQHGMTPTDFCAAHGWAGEDVWFAHMVHTSAEEIPRLAREGTGIAHCPQSNCRLGSGVAPIPQMAQAGVRLSIGVDGSASNEAPDMISETHQAWLVHRGSQLDANATQVEDVVHWASRGGANILGLDNVGIVAPGMAADLVLYRLDHPRYWGIHDVAVAPVVAGGAPSIKLSMVQGEPVVKDGVVVGASDSQMLANETRNAVHRLTR